MSRNESTEQRFVQFEVAMPTNDADEICIEWGELERRLTRYAAVSAGRDPSHSFLNRPDALRRAKLTFKPGKLGVSVAIQHREAAVSQSRSESKRALSRDLFEERADEQLKLDVDECLSGVLSVQPVIDEVSAALQIDRLTIGDIANLDAVIKNPALRRFAVEGDEMDVDVDGAAVHIESVPLRNAVVMGKTTDIEVALHQGKGGFSGKVIGVHAGTAGMVKPGISVMLGWIGDRDDTRATLMFARHFGFNVVLRVRQAISTKRMKLVTLEVVDVLNQAQVIERTRQALDL